MERSLNRIDNQPLRIPGVERQEQIVILRSFVAGCSGSFVDDLAFARLLAIRRLAWTCFNKCSMSKNESLRAPPAGNEPISFRRTDVGVRRNEKGETMQSLPYV